MAGRHLKSIMKTFELLNLLSEHGSSTPTAFAEQMDIPVSTVHDYLSTLESMGYAVSNEGEYSISARMLYFGSKMREDSQLFQTAKPVAKELSQQSGEQAVVSAVEGKEIIYIYTHSNNDQYDLSIHPGITVPLHVSASGKAVLAHLSEGTRTAYIRDSIVSDAAEDVKGEDLKREFESIREKGYATAKYQRGTESIAAPIHRQGEIVGTISVGGPSSRMRKDEFRDGVIENVLNAANLIEINMMQYAEP